MPINDPGPAIAKHKYAFKRASHDLIKLVIFDVCIGTVRKREDLQFSWHCTLPCIPGQHFYGIEATQEDAQNKLLDISNTWFTVIDQ